MMNIIGKTVNIQDVGLLSFFYPNFLFKDRLFFDKESSVVFIGEVRKDLLSYLTEGSKEFINTVGPYDFDLDNREIMLSFVYGKWNKVPKESVISICDGMPEIDFLNYIKQFWLLGKNDKEDKAPITIFDFYKALCSRSKNQMIKVYMELLDYYSASQIEHALLTFLDKSLNYKDLSVSSYYLIYLKNFGDTYGSKIKDLLMMYKVRKEPKNLKMLWFILNL